MLREHDVLLFADNTAVIALRCELEAFPAPIGSHKGADPLRPMAAQVVGEGVGLGE